MKPRRLKAKYLWIVVGLIIAIGCDDDAGPSKSAAHQTLDTVDTFWVSLNKKAEAFDPQSDLDDLRREKAQVSEQLEGLKQKAGSEYDLLQAQYKRLDAAERLKEMQGDMAKLKETGKSLQETAGKASAGLAEAQKAYQSAQEKYSQIKAKVEKDASGTGLSLP